MRKIKISSITTALVVFLTFFVSCTNEELVPNEPDGPVLNQGRVVFNVNTGKSMVCTRASAEDEQAIRSLGVFIVKPDGNLAEGVTRFYESQVLTGNKLTVSIPLDIMETPGIKAYLVANGPDKTQCDGLKTEQEVLGLVATTKPEEISTKGIPMASGAISLNFTGGIATVDANMKRVMSTLYAKVVKSKGVVVGPSDFTFKVHGVSGKEGYCFKDECKDTGVEKVWNSTSKSQEEEVSLGYFYQSKAFQVEVVSQSTAQSRTVEIPLEKAQTRNKKYVLKIHPKPVSEGKGEFTVTVEAWDPTEVDVDFEKKMLEIFLYYTKSGIFTLKDEDLREEAPFNSFVDNIASGFKLVDLELKNTLNEQKRGIFTNAEDHLTLYRTKAPALKKIDGTLTCTLEHESGYRIKMPMPIRILPPPLIWNDEFEQKTDDANFKVVDGVLVCTITNDSAKKLTLDPKSIQQIDDKEPPKIEYVASSEFFRNGDAAPDKTVNGDIDIDDKGVFIITYTTSIKGYAAIIGLEQRCGASYLWLYFK
ncbi:hypothetical protein AE938_18715 [Bacteroides fragilis]|uniref:hypothetical protein n=1 Tax=Bacteroides fragilis TaxID=817 RepID=UPI001CA920CA|nr:hypothetical protein [Bacteroides fragilis]MBY2900847.1 hypothetical protein [Bacteroides fragilis]